MKPAHVFIGLVAILVGTEIFPVNIGRVLHVYDFPKNSVGLEGPFAPNEARLQHDRGKVDGSFKCVDLEAVNERLIKQRKNLSKLAVG
eukprot:1139837-Pelagomonas_calceolata.AAC.7